MTRRLNFRPEALTELFEAADWYEVRKTVLREDFLRIVGEYLETILRNPFQYQIIYRHVRRAVFRHRFPYSIIYSVSDDEILVIACFHGRRDPGHWRKRV